MLKEGGEELINHVEVLALTELEFHNMCPFFTQITLSFEHRND